MSPENRLLCLELVRNAMKDGAGKQRACELLGVSMRTVERWEHKPEDGRKGPSTKPHNSLTNEERLKIIAVANSEEFASLTPWQIVPKLADRGEYIASESSFYRILREEHLLAHRSRCLPKRLQKPEELIAQNPNEIWSWDITYLRAAVKGTFYYLYLPMDVFSRFIVHWEIHESESADLASKMVEVACKKQGIKPEQVILHSDNGGPMKGATMLATLQRLGVAPSFSRPRVSDDNPYSESLFKTLKYCPSYPERGFVSLDHAKQWVEKFVNWYNNIHLHSGINWTTPSSRHQNQDHLILEKRHEVYQKAKAKNPERWSKQTRNWSRQNVVELNPGRRMKTKKTNSISQQAS